MKNDTSPGKVAVAEIGDISRVSLSLVKITDETIVKVAERTGESIERVRRYLDTSEQDNALLAAFLFFGIGLLNKFSIDRPIAPTPSQ